MKKNSVYALKKGQDYSKLIRNEKMWTEDQMKFLKDDLKDSLVYFGYTNNPESDE
jgi:hypothetical protein